MNDAWENATILAKLGIPNFNLSLNRDPSWDLVARSVRHPYRIQVAVGRKQDEREAELAIYSQCGVETTDEFSLEKNALHHIVKPHDLQTPSRTWV